MRRLLAAALALLVLAACEPVIVSPGPAVTRPALQDDAKNQSSYLTWKEGVPEADVAQILRRDFLVSEERAGKLAGAWGRHPLLGRMYLPAYRAGTEKVAALRTRYPSETILPVLYGCAGLVDIVTIDSVLAHAG